MGTEELKQLSRDYYVVEKAIYYLEKHFKDHPPLEEAAAALNMSPSHFHRIFRRWAGITPDRFQKFLTLQYTKRMLQEGQSILETAYDAGLSSPGRLHDLFVSFEAVSPGEYKRRGEAFTIEYGFQPTPFGLCLAAFTFRGICGLGFHEPGTEEEALSGLKARWPGARFEKNANRAAELVKAAFRGTEEPGGRPTPLLVRGTNFQVKIWQALLEIPPGVVVSYGDLARFIDAPRSVRAVAGAVAANPVAYLIPCHRVIAWSGHIHGYHWKPERKRLMLAREALIRAEIEKV